ncbi:MAG: FMN-binding glutamate synthase family protein [Steroidobacteraceae bacterium]
MARLSRYSFFLGCVLLALGTAAAAPRWPMLWLVAAVAGALCMVGVFDLVQKPRAILRNYPVLGHVRYLVESVRPEIRQYLLESDREQLPFSREQRSLIYQRAKDQGSEKPFGTLTDVYGEGHEFIGHSAYPAPAGRPESFRVRIGGPQCREPDDASILNISAMSFGALSANAIRALNRGARRGGFAHDTGEGGISPYHREGGGDLIWEIGSGYFGCRDEKGRFDPQRFAAQARNPQVKMVEIKLSQGAKPGHGGILPAHKVSAEIAATRGVPMGEDCVSPPRHGAFDSPLGLVRFIGTLRDLCGGKPVGFKLCIGHPWEFMSIVKAMLELDLYPDFIVVDGAEGGTGAAPVEFADHIGMPMREGLQFVHNALIGTGLRERIRVGASGKIASAFDVARALALGADWVNAARAFMFAIGCIQSQSCHTNRCPTGVATQDRLRQRALVVEDKALRVQRFHHRTLEALAELLAAAGLQQPAALKPHHLVRRVNGTQIRLFSQIHTALEPGELLRGWTRHEFYASAWRMARAASFDAAPDTAGEGTLLWDGLDAQARGPATRGPEAGAAALSPAARTA